MISPLVHLGDHVVVTTTAGETVTRGTLVNRALPLVVVQTDDDGTFFGVNVMSHNVKRIPS